MTVSTPRAATRMTYGEQLKHPNWQRVRLECLNAAGWKCQHCGDSESTLHVHHRRYIKGRMAWEYPRENFVVLCEECHESQHVDRELLERVLCELPPNCLPAIVTLVAGWAFQEVEVETVQATLDGPGDRVRLSNVGTLARYMFDSALDVHAIADLQACVSHAPFVAALAALIREHHAAAVGLE
jgi:hypothetical protein